MVVYNLYIFDRHCNCVFFSTWNRKPTSNTAASTSRTNLLQTTPEPGISEDSSDHRPNSALAGAVGIGGASASGGDISFEEESKLVYGVILSLRNMVSKLTGKSSEGFIAYKTSAYKLHYFETPTGLKFVMNTDSNMESCREALRQIYAQIYVEYVAKNPLVKFDTPITNELFRISLNKFVKGMAGFD
ncbi:hypothetical protein SmJEL517_g04798 [Synchytrium microbalum]|uniref:Trafficking protein particle complex subunit n=1 Tax=Synchytrium microbalum TaxID=1806994 RepID=A0A507C384_9FUNG|nr:uncharacterized protein SmJEL517_g04798 [Synchytrium microbalum]TPX31973.1 hypothetical protein SmJEL517_g04798 [Synchytrium microbalum]